MKCWIYFTWKKKNVLYFYSQFNISRSFVRLLARSQGFRISCLDRWLFFYSLNFSLTKIRLIRMSYDFDFWNFLCLIVLLCLHIFYLCVIFFWCVWMNEWVCVCVVWLFFFIVDWFFVLVDLLCCRFTFTKLLCFIFYFIYRLFCNLKLQQLLTHTPCVFFIVVVILDCYSRISLLLFPCVFFFLCTHTLSFTLSFYFILFFTFTI